MSQSNLFYSRFFWRIYLTNTVLFLAIIASLGWFGYHELEKSMETQIYQILQEKAFVLKYQARFWFAGHTPAQANMIRKIGYESGTRITVIDVKGMVLLDSHKFHQEMDNHNQRPEIIEARKVGKGKSKRFSNTMGESMHYFANRLENNGKTLGILRVSSSASRFERDLEHLRWIFFIWALIAVGASLVFGFLLAGKVAIPIMEIRSVCQSMMDGRYSVRVKKLPNDEIGQLGRTLNALGGEITKKIYTITQDRIQLGKLEKIRSDFVANVSHEIKTPLTAIQGYSETLLSMPFDGDPIYKKFIEKIYLNASRLSMLTHEILVLARLENPDQPVSQEPIDWYQIVYQISKRYEDDLFKKKLKLEISLDKELKVLGEAKALTLIVDNLVSNAIRYTHERGQICIRTFEDGDEGCLEVVDTGIGIAQEDQERVFERFYRVDKARSRDIGGTGLGLAIAKHTASKLNGSISLESIEGKGSAFTVRLKRQEILPKVDVRSEGGVLAP